MSNPRAKSHTHAGSCRAGVQHFMHSLCITSLSDALVEIKEQVCRFIVQLRAVMPRASVFATIIDNRRRIVASRRVTYLHELGCAGGGSFWMCSSPRALSRTRNVRASTEGVLCRRHHETSRQPSLPGSHALQLRSLHAASSTASVFAELTFNGMVLAM